MRAGAILFAVVLTAISLGGCDYLLGYFIGEGPMVAELHNPITREKAVCGEGMVKGPDWINGVRKERDKCISTLEAKGFVLDCADPPITSSARYGRWCD
jgi:hypothetical protein